MQLDPSAVGGAVAADQLVPLAPVAPVAVDPAATAS